MMRTAFVLIVSWLYPEQFSVEDNLGMIMVYLVLLARSLWNGLGASMLTKTTLQVIDKELMEFKC